MYPLYTNPHVFFWPNAMFAQLLGSPTSPQVFLAWIAQGLDFKAATGGPVGRGGEDPYLTIPHE